MKKLIAAFTIVLCCASFAWGWGSEFGGPSGGGGLPPCTQNGYVPAWNTSTNQWNCVANGSGTQTWPSGSSAGVMAYSGSSSFGAIYNALNPIPFNFLTGAASTGANTFTGDQTISTHNIITDSTTGSKIGTASTQKLGFFGATPVVQQTGDILTAFTTLGFVTSPSISEADVTNLLTDLGNKVSTSTTVNGHALTGNVTVTPADLGLVIGTNVQAYNANLTTLAGITPGAEGQSLLAAANAAAVKTLLGYYTSADVGVSIEAYSAILAAIAGTSQSTGYLYWNGSAWVYQTPSGTAAWGGITGTLSSQTDLQNALNAKQSISAVYSNGTETTTLTFTASNGVNQSVTLTTGDALVLSATGGVNQQWMTLTVIVPSGSSGTTINAVGSAGDYPCAWADGETGAVNVDAWAGKSFQIGLFYDAGSSTYKVSPPPPAPGYAVIIDSYGRAIASTVADATLAYLDATSSVQTQLNGKQASSSNLTTYAAQAPNSSALTALGNAPNGSGGFTTYGTDLPLAGGTMTGAITNAGANNNPTYSSTTTATGNINIDGASYADYNYNDGSTAVTYTPVITSPPPSGTVRYITFSVGGSSGVCTMTWTNVTFMGTSGASATTAGKVSRYVCMIPHSGNAICQIINEGGN